MPEKAAINLPMTPKFPSHLDETSVVQYWSKVYGVVFEILRLKRCFSNKIINFASAQLIECLAGEQEGPGSFPRKGEIFFT